MFAGQAIPRSARAAVASGHLAASASVRRFAAEAAEQRVKPPVAVFGLDGTYATALVRDPTAPETRIRRAHDMDVNNGGKEKTDMEAE